MQDASNLLYKASHLLNRCKNVLQRGCRVTVATLMKSEKQSVIKQKLEIRRIWFDLIWCYKIVFGMVRVTPDQFFEFRVSSPRGHPFKLYKRCNFCRIRSLFFTERVINIWNKLPVSIIDFRTLSSFKKSLHRIDLTDLLADA